MFNPQNELTKEIKAFDLLVVGVGNAGCNVLSAIEASGSEGPYSVAVHTSHQKLAQTKLMRSIQIGASVTEGASTGGDIKLGRICAESDEEQLKELFSGYKLVVFVTGLGGGTGSGAAPVLVRIARDMGCFTVCIATLPFKFEASDKRRKAEMGLAALQEQSHAVVCFPNERLFELLGGRKDLKRGIRAVEEYFVSLVRGIWDMLNQHGLIHIDFGDLTTLVSHSDGTCTLATAQAAGSDAIDQICEILLEAPLLDRGAVLSSASALIISIKGGPDLSIDETNQLVKRLLSKSREDVRVSVGVTVDERWEGRMEVMLVASEFWVTSIKSEQDTATGVPSSSEAAQPSLVQTEIVLDTPAGKGKFVNVAPTVHHGEDLDVPTFVRRNVKLSRNY